MKEYIISKLKKEIGKINGKDLVIIFSESKDTI